MTTAEGTSERERERESYVESERKGRELQLSNWFYIVLNTLNYA